jgi:16S rRNA (guanine966-N2)-methyltransferase
MATPYDYKDGKKITGEIMPKNKTMRITGGYLVRRRFFIPAMVDEGTVRPTSDRVREAIFSMLAKDLYQAEVLDLFAGSGAHGFEAISRGAESVRFVEKDPRVALVIKQNIEALDLAKKCKVEIQDASNWIMQPIKSLFDVVFVDPPYSLNLSADFFNYLLGHLVEDGVVVFRCFKKFTPLFGEHFIIERDRVYGGTRVFILRRALT